MAISFKTLTQNDKTTSRTLLHEAIPISGDLISETYPKDANNRGTNIKTFSHGMFQSVYDYPYVNSSANHLFDVTWGYVNNANVDQATEGSNIVGSVTNQQNKKKNIYSQMAQILAGYDIDGAVRQFDFDGEYGEGDIIGTAAFISFSRLLVKDEIKKGSFSLTLGTGDAYADQFSSEITLTDTLATSSYKINSPAGEFGLLFTGSSNAPGSPRGLIFYQAGIVVLPISADEIGGTEGDSNWYSADGNAPFDTKGTVLKDGTIDQFNDGFIRRIKQVQFNNTTELNSTIYFCRANNSEFNYSSNPTYLDGSKIRVKKDPGTKEELNLPRSYVTTVGLYSHDNELMAVAKLSEPIRKDPTNELNLRVRLDY
tara:strand:+ start:233 stop:1342 length:1110 start_codon:yes stop_codon:yes gene_type:complete